MTATSLFPEAAGVAGLPMRRWCDALVVRAHARGADARDAARAASAVTARGRLLSADSQLNLVVSGRPGLDRPLAQVSLRRPHSFARAHREKRFPGESRLALRRADRLAGALPGGDRALSSTRSLPSSLAVSRRSRSATRSWSRGPSPCPWAAWCSSRRGARRSRSAAWRFPSGGARSVEYLVTEKHVIWRRGPLRRTIDREADQLRPHPVESARCRHGRSRHRARRSDRGPAPHAVAHPPGRGRRPIASGPSCAASSPACPSATATARCAAPRPGRARPLVGLPAGVRRGRSTRGHGRGRRGVLALPLRRSLVKRHPPLARVLRLHALPPGLAAVLVGGAALGMLLLLAVAVGVAYVRSSGPVRLARDTRYFVTDARVLIRRGNEELSLDRSRIAYVIERRGRSSTTCSSCSTDRRPGRWLRAARSGPKTGTTPFARSSPPSPTPDIVGEILKRAA